MWAVFEWAGACYYFLKIFVNHSNCDGFHSNFDDFEWNFDCYYCCLYFLNLLNAVLSLTLPQLVRLASDHYSEVSQNCFWSDWLNSNFCRPRLIFHFYFYHFLN